MTQPGGLTLCFAVHRFIGNESVPKIIINDTVNLFFTAPCYASAVLAMGLCPSVRPSVCPSQVGVLLKRLNVG